MVKKGDKEVPVYVAKNERELARGHCSSMNNITGIQCGNPPMHGTHVCWHHGGKLPSVKKAIEERLTEARLLLIEELDPTIKRLREIRDQDEHMPSALGASVQILNRTLGKPGEGEKDKGTGKMTIKVGVMIGARKRIDADSIAVATLVEKNPLDGDVIDGE